LAKETKGEKETLEKRALQDIAEKDKEIVEQAKAIQWLHQQLENEVRENQTLHILVEEKDSLLKIVGSPIEETETKLEKGITGKARVVEIAPQTELLIL
jgi:hypothetical protein